MRGRGSAPAAARKWNLLFRVLAFLFVCLACPVWAYFELYTSPENHDIHQSAVRVLNLCIDHTLHMDRVFCRERTKWLNHSYEYNIFVQTLDHYHRKWDSFLGATSHAIFNICPSGSACNLEAYKLVDAIITSLYIVIPILCVWVGPKLAMSLWKRKRPQSPEFMRDLEAVSRDLSRAVGSPPSYSTGTNKQL